MVTFNVWVNAYNLCTHVLNSKKPAPSRVDAPPLGSRLHSDPTGHTLHAATLSDSTLRPYINQPNLGAHTYAAGARNAQITDLAEQLKREVTPGGLYGINYGAGTGAGVATAISFAVSFLALLTPVLPGLGAGLFAGVLIGSILIGAAVQYHKRRKNISKPSVMLLAQQLETFENELTAIPVASRNGADLRDLRQVQALRAHLTWTFGQGLRQVGYGILGVQPYASLEEFCKKQWQRLPNLPRPKGFVFKLARKPKTAVEATLT